MNPVYGGMPTCITNGIRVGHRRYSVNQNKFLATGKELAGKICQVHLRCCYNHSSVKKLWGTISFYSCSLPFILP
jgi:hypothetical protein